MEKPKKNIVIFPFMAQSHIISFLALALRIEKYGRCQVTYVNTPLNIRNLKGSIPPNSTIRLLEIPFDGSSHGLPPGSENTDSLPYDLRDGLVEASLSLKPDFRTLLSDLIENGAPLLCVIADMFLGWTADVAHELGIFHAIFSSSGGFGLACYYSLWTNLPHRKTDLVEFSLPDFQEAGKIHVTQLAANLLHADGMDRMSRVLIHILSLWVNSDAILLNSVKEIDVHGMNYFRRKLSLSLWAIGPVLLSVDNESRGGKTFGIDLESCINWLNLKPSCSVLYISFGSHTTSASQMMQLAKALEKCGKNFIWVVRPPLGFDMNAKFDAEEWLPGGFVKRVEEQNKGLIISKWAPQVEILSHKSIAAFLSHCGWNSVLESLSYGVPLIGWPMDKEQFYDVKFLEEEMGVCVEVARGTHFEVRCEDIVDKIDMVMATDGKGKKMREKACEVERIIEAAMRDEGGYKGSSVKAMEEFLNTALVTKDEDMKKLENH